MFLLGHSAFIGFIEAGVPLGVTFSFLIAAPMINEVAVILLFGLFGWKIALIYVSTGLFIAILAGWIIGKLRLEHFVADWVYKIKSEGSEEPEERLSFDQRIRVGLDSVKEIVGKVWIYIVIGVGVRAAVHGFVPEKMMADLMGQKCVVFGSAFRPDRSSALLKCSRHYSDCQCSDRKRRSHGYSTGVHDVGDRPFTSRNDHSEKSAQTPADFHLCGRSSRRES